MNKHGLFQRGVRPTLEMRAKMSAAQRRRWAGRSGLEPFLAKVQALLDEVHRALESKPKGNGHARLVSELASPADPSQIQSFWPTDNQT